MEILLVIIYLGSGLLVLLAIRRIFLIGKIWKSIHKGFIVKNALCTDVAILRGVMRK